MEIATLYVTAPHRESALSIARQLVENRLIACANIVEGVTSVYRWEDQIQTDAEVILLLKTRVDLIETVTEQIRSLHPYDCPCIVAWKSVGGNEPYLKWVETETGPLPPDLA
ncbi:divalent-cation tolerance protein CutA [Planctomicrobium piriforme]|uniref:Divalent cation tolerance protein n=1 Tax=Planctomicrobium piriforme TaxID=1576369 RepID=A0A1I3L7T4_9PLAN|nr:divalent-cation tolerance protein CutA [Planctomicrobium piriforme]SFI80748.1 divalent cation tolerance protein [Planctomicrobium piriforme]